MPCSADTDWAQIAALYLVLETVAPSPVVRLNRAVAVAEAGQPGVALDIVEGLAEELRDYHLFHATRGELLLRLGRDAEAAKAFGAAHALTDNLVEQRHLERRRVAARTTTSKD